MKRRGYQLAAVVMAMGLVAAACSSESKTTTTSPVTTVAGPSTSAAETPTTVSGASTTSAAGETTTSGEAASTTTAAGGTGQFTDDQLVKWALDYTGGKAGAAAGDSIKIGYINQEDFFPENTIGINAAVDFVNKELGGAAGRPLEIVPCKISTPEDGAKCGAQMANDPNIQVVVTGTILYGNKEMYDSLNGKKAVIIGNGLTTDDFTTAAGVAFTAGSPGVIPGMAGAILQYIKPGVKKVAVLASSNPAGQAAANVLFKPVMDKAGVAVAVVSVDDTASVADVQTAMTTVGAADADVFVPLVT
ncbi:MAG: hypothetical protein ABIQ39_01470, partial [Ilumatobacteraceae bacterium]